MTANYVCAPPWLSLSKSSSLVPSSVTIVYGPWKIPSLQKILVPAGIAFCGSGASMEFCSFSVNSVMENQRNKIIKMSLRRLFEQISNFKPVCVLITCETSIFFSLLLTQTSTFTCSKR